VRRLYLLCSSFLLLSVLSGVVLAQEDAPRPQPGDPPRADLITVTPADEAGEVTISGAQNAVFPTAQLTIRNLYTQDVVYTQAGISGSFSVGIFGEGSTPFLISPTQGTIPAALQDRPGSLPGGPATIVWGGLPQVDGERVRFSVAGALGEEERWAAQGEINRVLFDPEDPQPLAMRLDMIVPLPSGGQADLRFIASLELLPIAVRDANGLRPVGSIASNNGWSGVLTPSGLAIDDIGTTIPIGEAVANSDDIATVLEGLAFSFAFENRLPGSLLPGLYVPVVRPLIRAGDARPEPLYANAVYGSSTVEHADLVRLPLVLNVGGVGDVPLPFALFMDTPSDGGRGVLPAESEGISLSNRVRYNPPTYILPPNGLDGTPLPYTLEPYLPQMLANAYDQAVAPLIPFAGEIGSLSVTVEAPDGTRTRSGALPIRQARIGTEVLDERALFGVRSPLDMYALTTLNSALSAHPFTQYGEHTITVQSNLSDVLGNTYVGGGIYRVLIAEQIDMTPAALPGTPFELGDALHAGLRIAPSVAADVRVTVRVYPLDGSAVEELVIEGQANSGGVFQPESPVIFETPGEYVVDYDVRYTDAEGRLWAGSLRSAGVIASGGAEFVARGERGLWGIALEPQQAWYSAERVLANAGLDAEENPIILRAPYHSGDAAWVPDGTDGGIAPTFSVQDVFGSYAAWLINGANTDASPFGGALRQRVAALELPVALLAEDADPYNPASAAAPINQGYRYVSLVRPNVTLRQFISGSLLPTLPVWVDMDDPSNGQLGAGFAGAQPGDYFFMFGGTILRNSEIGIANSGIYGAVGMVTEADATPGARIASPARGADGAADAGALLVLPNDSYDAFLLPTGIQPGDVLTLGDPVVVSGQTAPALPVTVAVTLTSPSGTQRQTFGRANAVGYYYDPTQDFAVDETGVWTVDIQVVVDAQTSAGQPNPPFAFGGIPGSPSGRYLFYVIERPGDLLERAARADITIPSALPYNFSFTLPQDWTGEAISYTLRADGYVLEQGDLRFSGRTFTYQHNPTNINRRFPNMEVEARVDGAAASDVRQLTFFVRATDENGAPRLLYRIYHFFHDRLISLNEEAQ
jgi:hypothetical protein